MENITKPNLNGWTIYTKSDCIYCSEVKKILENKSCIIINCDKWIECDKQNKENFLNQMKVIIGYEYKKFPMVFCDKIFIGGYKDVEKYLKSKFVISEDF